MSKTRPGWMRYLDVAVFADRISVKASTGYSAFYLMYGWDLILPIEFQYPTWRLIDWDAVHNTYGLLEARIRVLERKADDIAQAWVKVMEYRQQLARRTDKANTFKIRKEELQPGDLVLVYNVKRSNDLSRTAKMQARWDSPYRITYRAPITLAYHLKTLDGIDLCTTFPADRIKAFYKDESGWWTSDLDPWLLSPSKGEDTEEEGDAFDTTEYDAYSVPITRQSKARQRQQEHQEDLESADESDPDSPADKTPTSKPRNRGHLEVHLRPLTPGQRAQYHQIE
ncbi:hypothetical protein S7711_10127 [Stachybotrys chartarum IBT 7711]|uniref:Uncharacterized protein n=1 Tax=Stachybotrys chartarum (strain CBS 109288 / IBT 7711) TaxID=1280523 RepID=A0A084AX32_STACB|nr:hypothetical protein S7711_10127 [Stachybotrys chartarum IBT 7711]